VEIVLKIQQNVPHVHQVNIYMVLDVLQLVQVELIKQLMEFHALNVISLAQHVVDLNLDNV
jgi:hypothetical protein